MDGKKSPGIVPFRPYPTAHIPCGTNTRNGLAVRLEFGRQHLTSAVDHAFWAVTEQLRGAGRTGVGLWKRLWSEALGSTPRCVWRRGKMSPVTGDAVGITSD